MQLGMRRRSVSKVLVLKVLDLSLESKGQCNRNGDHISVSINLHLSAHTHTPHKNLKKKTTLALPSLQLSENTIMAAIDPSVIFSFNRYKQGGRSSLFYQ